MRLIAIDGNSQKLDGGSMFGNCPRALWERWIPPDAKHRIDLACRALLIETNEGKRVLCEAGVGTFFPPELRARYGVQESDHMLLENLRRNGIEPESIDAVVLSHLHFDHVGGLLTPWEEGKAPGLVFPKAHYVIGRRAWERAQAPHPRDRASFIADFPAILQAGAGGRIELLEDGQGSAILGEAFSFTFSDGHTPGLVATRFTYGEHAVTYPGDLIPGRFWVHAPITMGYDRYPELIIDEKANLLQRLTDDGSWLFFTHDPTVSASRVRKDARGRFEVYDECAGAPVFA